MTAHMTPTLDDLDNAHRYAKLAARLLEKAQEAKQRGDEALTESRVENAKGFLARATKVLEPNTNELGRLVHNEVFGGPPTRPTLAEVLAAGPKPLSLISRERAREMAQEKSYDLLPPNVFDDCVARGWLYENEHGDFLWDEKELAKGDE